MGEQDGITWPELTSHSNQIPPATKIEPMGGRVGDGASKVKQLVYGLYKW